MRLNNLKLTNFQGIELLEIQVNGNDISILGDNGSGKTTVANAICYLLYGKPSNGEKNYSPKTVDKNGEDKHYLNHIVEGSFIMKDNSILTLKKDFHEVWTKKRGSNTESFTGNILEYYIDGVPVSATQYQKRIEMIADDNTIKMLTIPDYFANQIKWQDRRNILLEICGNVSDEDVIEKNEDLKVLKEFLKKPGNSDLLYTVDEFTAIAKKTKQDVNKKLESIPARIDEATKSIKEANEPIDAIENSILNVEKEIELEKAAMNSSDTTSLQLQIKQQIQEVELKETQAKTAYVLNYQNSIQGNGKIISDLTESKNSMNGKLNNLISACKNLTESIQGLEKRRELLLEKYKQESEKEWSGNTECPTCKQQIPEEDIQKAIEEFNLNKSNSLESIKSQSSDCNKDIIEGKKEELKQLEIEKITIEDDIYRIEKEIVSEKEKIIPMDAYETTEEWNSFQEDKKILKEKLDAVFDSAIKFDDSRLIQLKRNLNELQTKKIDIENNKNLSARIDELKQDEQDLTDTYNRMEQGIYLSEEFMRRKSEMLDDLINSKFETVKFKLYNTQINGGQADCCDVMINTTEGLKSFNMANTGARIKGGIEIINTLSKHYDVELPIIIDNCESVTDLGYTDAQQIRTYVREGILGLRIV